MQPFQPYRYPPRFASRRSNVFAQGGMVATSNYLASAAGLRVLENGGNAIDAAVVAAFVMTVVEPHSSHVGGDAFAIIARPNGELVGLNASGRAPARLTREHVAAARVTKIPREGPLSIAVPGQLDGLASMLGRFGTIGLDTALEPAIRYAENGFVVSEESSARWVPYADKLKKYSSGPNPYLVDGRGPNPGELFRMPAYARTLRTIAEGGPEVFYRGKLAAAICAGAAPQGALIAPEDFAAYRSEWVDTIAVDYRGVTVHELPPNGQGLVATLAIGALAEHRLGEFGTPELVHLQAEAVKAGFAAGVPLVADPDWFPLSKASFGRDALKRLAKEIDPRRASVRSNLMPPGSDTIFLCVGDAQGNLVSLITSVFSSFGSGIVAGDTGVILQNRAANFSLDPDSANALEPGKRAYNTIIPGMAVRDGRPWMAFGVMGGGMQPQGHLQVMANLVDFGMTPQEALDAPRFRIGAEGEVNLEPSFAGVQSGLEKLGHRTAIEGKLGYYGGGQIVMREGDVLIGATDPRKDGVAIGF